jgi:magnesium transporter
MIHLLKNKTRQPVLYSKSPKGENQLDHIKISLLEYTEDSLIEKENINVKECLNYLQTASMTWIQVYGTSNSSIISTIAKHFKIHSLALEDILSNYQRPKLDIYQNQLFLIARVLTWKENRDELLSEQVSLIVGPNYLITFSLSELPLFNSIKERLRQPNNRFKSQGPDFLAYNILDAIVDQYFVVLEAIDVRLEKLEDELMRSSKPTTLQNIQNAKRTMIFLRRSIWPLRDVINSFQHLDPPFLSATTKLYLSDVYDHVIQVIDIIEGFRDVVAGMLDIYLSNINIRTNEIMKFLTIVSTIFVPLTFIASLYGMNFAYMPGLNYHGAFSLIVGVMMAMTLMMLLYFWRKKWI